MSGLRAVLSIDVSKLDAMIGQAGGAHDASAVFAATSPLGLLGDAGKLIATIEDIAEKPENLGGAISTGLSHIGNIAPFADVSAIGEVISLFTEIKGRLQPLGDLAGLDPAALVNRAAQSGGGLDGMVQGLAGQFADAIGGAVPDGLATPLNAIRDLASGAPTSGAEVAGFIARFVLGLDLDVLREPFEALDALRGQIAQCGGDGAPLEARLQAVTAKVNQAADDLLGAAPDTAAILAGLTAVRAEVADLTENVIPAALARLTGDLSAIDVKAIAHRLDAGLAPLLARVPSPPRGIGDLFLPPLRGLADGVDGLTVDVLDAAFAEIEASIKERFAQSEVAVLRDQATELLSGVTGYLNALPLVALRAKLTGALLGIEEKIGQVADYSPVHLLSEKVLKITEAIDGIDLSAITGRIAALKDQLQHVIDEFPIQQIKTELQSLVGAANDAVAGLPPLIDSLKAKIDDLAKQITTINLDQAAEQSVGALHDVRGHVKNALASADLPDVLKVPIGVLAGEVRKIDISAAIDAPLGDLVAKVDITALLAPLQHELDLAKAALARLSPSALVAELDKPFNAMTAALESLSPAALVAQLSTEFKKAVDQLDRANPQTLIQPLQAEFDKALGALRKAADPAPLLAPLHAVYHELTSLLDMIDPAKLLAKLLAQVTRLPGAVSDAATTALSQKVGAGGALLGPAAAEAMKFGDIVRPFAMLIGEARAVVRRTAEGVIAEGLEQVSRPLALLSHAGQVAGGHVVHLGEALETRRGLVDLNAAGGALPALHAALARLARVEGMLSVAGRSTVQINAAVTLIQLDAHAIASHPARQALALAMDGVVAGVQTAPIGRGFVALGHVIADFAPTSLAFPDTEKTILARLDALFDAIDPSPIADEMDLLGEKILGKLQSFAADIAKALFRIWNTIFDSVLPILPQSMINAVSTAFDAIRFQLATLDPAQLEKELGELLDSVVAALEAYSPAAFAASLGDAFAALKTKLQALDPAVLLGDLNPLKGLIDQFKTLQPSLILAPLTAQAQAVETALSHLLDLDLGKVMTDAVANLTVQVEDVLHKIEVELDGLLGDLQADGGGGGAVSVSVSAAAG